MKPIKLQLENIGPFVGKKVIDFSSLGDMFLICGDTGSGKTTILDSINYALYGQIPGNYSPEPRTMRSDYAKTEEPCSVTFEFLLNKNRYKVVRKPPCIYTNRNGKTSEKPAEVAVYKTENNVIPDWEIISNRTNEANIFIEELIGLSADEFSRIVLLPQGDFANFLHMNSNERRASLEKLFPVKDYKEITDFAYEKYNTYRIELNSVIQKIEALSSAYKNENAEKDIENISNDEAVLTEKNKTLQNQLIALSQEYSQAESLLKKIKDCTEAEKKAEQLELKSEEIDTLTEKLEKAKKASNLYPVLEALKKSESQYSALQKEMAETQQNLEKAQIEKTELESFDYQINLKQEQNKLLEKNIQDLQHAVEIEKSLHTATDKYDDCKARQKLISSELKKTKDEISNLEEKIKLYEPIVIELDERYKNLNFYRSERDNLQIEKKKADDYVGVFKLCKDSQESFESKKNELEQQKQAVDLLQSELKSLEQIQEQEKLSDMAVSLSLNLEEGTPCPVCGSTHHPHLASTLAHDVSIEKQIELKKKLLEQAQTDEADLSKSFTRIESKLEVFLKQKESFGISPDIDAQIYQQQVTNHLAEIAKKLQDADNKASEASKAQRDKIKSENTLMQLRQKVIPEQTAFDNIKNKLIEAETEQKKYQELYLQLTKDKLKDGLDAAKTVEQYEQILKDNESLITDHEKNKSKNKELLTSLNARLEQYAQTSRQQNEQLEESRLQLNTKLKEKGFSNSEELLQSYLTEKDISVIEDEIKAYNSEKNSLATLIQTYKNEIGSRNVPDCSKLEDEIKSIQEQIDQNSKASKELAAQKQFLLSQKKEWEELEEKRTELSKESELYQMISNDLSGANPKSIDFESWILGVYLEEITIHASKRLERISDGRYKLLTKTNKESSHQKKQGLDLEIFDSYTGKIRSCKTLSGGETFLVSISLALALTDVVQSKSGGIQLDSLFIDEGFGTLDEGTLEKALSILDEIRVNRMIGIISHVGELKNRISSRIELKKTTTGSTITQVS